MSWLPSLFKKKEVVIHEADSRQLQVAQTQALTTLAEATKDIAAFLNGGGLHKLVSGYARSQSAQAILGGLAAHDGRAALDARTLGQNALETVKQVEVVFDKFEAELRAKGKNDPTLHDAEADFKKRGG